jgi:hypothetical protein
MEVGNWLGLYRRNIFYTENIFPWKHERTERIQVAALAHVTEVPARAVAYSSWLKHYATGRKVTGSIPDEIIGFFNWPNPSSRTMVRGSTL